MTAIDMTHHLNRHRLGILQAVARKGKGRRVERKIVMRGWRKGRKRGSKKVR
jgi:hypothetical protein